MAVATPVLIGTTITLVIALVVHASRHEARHEAAALFQKEAVVQGHAEYIVTEDGAPKWQWKPVTKESE